MLLRVLAVVAATLCGLELGYRVFLRGRGQTYDADLARQRLEELRDVDQRALIAPELADAEEKDGRDPEELLLHPFLGFAPRGKTTQLADELRAVQASTGDAFEIVILGGSVAGMFYAHGGERLIELLRADPRLREREIRCVPFSTGGYKQPQQSIRLLELLHRGMEPEVVLEIDGYNELALGCANLVAAVDPYFPSFGHWSHLAQGGLGDPRAVDEIVAVHALRRALERSASRMLALGLHRSAVLGRLGLARLESLRSEEVRHLERYAELVSGGLDPAMLRGPGLRASVSESIPDIVRAWEEASRTMHDLCAARGILYLHVLQPALHDEGSKPLTPLEIEAGTTSPAKLEGVRSGYPLLRLAGERLRAHGVSFVDASDLFASESKTMYRDPCHYNAPGSRMLAERIAPALLSALEK